MKKTINLLALLVLLLTTITSCGKDAEIKAEKKLIGIVLPTKDEPRWLQDEKRFRDLLSGTDYNVEIVFSQGSSATEKQNVENLITKQADVIIITAQDGAAAGSAVEEAKEAGISIIAYDRLITETDAVDYYVTFDSVSVGEAQGQYLVDKAGNGKGLPLYLYAGDAGDNNAFLFFEGAWNVLQPKIEDGTFVIANSSEAIKLADKLELTRGEKSKIIGQVTTRWDFNEAKKKAESHLTTAGPNQKGNVFILAPNDGTARAIADTFGNDDEVTSFEITGQDAEVTSMKYILDGKQSMSVFKDVRILAKDAIEVALNVLENKEIVTNKSYNNGVKDVPAIATEVNTITIENLEEILVNTGYYSKEELGM